MLYEFPVPTITDTKNLKKVFVNKKYINKEGLSKLDEVVKQRSHFKQALKDLRRFNGDENVPNHIVEALYAYAEKASTLEQIFNTSYKISKNFKWTPILSSTRILKFSKDIKFGVAAEIIMARYCAFAAQFRQVNIELSYIIQNLVYLEGESIQADTNFSVIKQVDPIITKLKETSQTVSKRYVDSYLALTVDGQRSSSLFQTLSQFPANYIETKGIGIEIALLVVKINANALQVEYMRRQANYEEMGKYAKTIVIHATSLESYLKPFGAEADPSLVEFVQVSKHLYKAIALWSIFPPFLAKIKTQSYAKGENMNVLAEACVAFVDEISNLHKTLKAIPNIQRSPYNKVVTHYFTKVFVSRASEVSKVYGDLYKNSKYDETYFNRIKQADYIEEQLGDKARESMRKY